MLNFIAGFALCAVLDVATVLLLRKQFIRVLRFLDARPTRDERETRS